MSDPKSPVPVPPTQWRDSMHPVNHASVAAALAILGEEVPTAWEKARTAFRAAEWSITCRTSLNTLQQNRDLAAAGLADAEQRLAAKPGSLQMMEFVGSCTAIFDTCDEIFSAAVSASNGSNPVAVAAERKQRAAALHQARDQHTMRRTLGQSPSREEVDRLTDLIDAVAQDEGAEGKEQKEIATLQAAADSAKEKALDTLCDALDKKINAVARTIASLLTPRQVAIGREYPELVDPKIIETFCHAQNLAAISSGLDGLGVDVDESVGRLLSPEQHEVLGKIIWKSTRRFFGESRGRHRGRRTE